VVDIAFKEWAVVDEALGTGLQTIVLRKGGIHERHGRFTPEYETFLIYPTYEHQRPEAVRGLWCDRIRDDRTDRGLVTIRHLARVIDVLTAPPRPESAGDWEHLHIYAPAVIRGRYEYRSELPLYVLLVRVYRLPATATVREIPAYAGCRSWVRLREPISVRGAEPVLDDVTFADRSREVRASLRR